MELKVKVNVYTGLPEETPAQRAEFKTHLRPYLYAACVVVFVTVATVMVNTLAASYNG